MELNRSLAEAVAGPRRQIILTFTNRVRLDFARDALALRDERGEWRVVAGEYPVACGTSSADPDALVGTLVLSE